jgi:hypothetical protein
MFGNMSLAKSEMELTKGGVAVGGTAAAGNASDIACLCWPGCKGGCGQWLE